MILSYSSTEFIRFNANMAFFKYVQVDCFTVNSLGWHLAPIPFFLSYFLFCDICLLAG